MLDRTLLPPQLTITEEDLQNTPPAALLLLEYLLRENGELKKQLGVLTKTLSDQSKKMEDMGSKLNSDSSNSSRPPSSDSPYKSKDPNREKKKPGAKKGHKGYRQNMLEPTEVRVIHPEGCSCGNATFHDLADYYTHQVIELPEIKMNVTHFVLQKGKCSHCGKVCKGVIPREHRTGFGPRLTALIAEMAGTQADSRSIIQNFW